MIHPNTHARVAVGQIWELTANYTGGRFRFRIDVVCARDAETTVLSTGRKTRVSILTLERRMRGATLVLEADGSVPVEVASIHRPRKAVERTASDYIKSAKGPRGLVRGGKLSALQLQIETLLAEGTMTLADIGRRLGISGDSVARHKQAILDVRAFERMREGA